MKDTAVIYHADCADGFTAAWVAWRQFGNNADYIPAHYGNAPPGPLPTTVYVLDFSYPRDVLESMAAATDRFVVLDHHKTAQEALAGLGFATFDLAHSGAYLAWVYFFPDGPVPPLVQYVEDRDLWKWALPNSREISAVIRSWDFDFTRWDVLNTVIDKMPPPPDIVREGAAILRMQKREAQSAARNRGRARIGDHIVPCVNATTLMSEIGEELCQAEPDAPFAATFFVRSDGKHIFSLRSRGSFDVSAVAKQLGGGGHPAAAGFTSDKGPVWVRGEQ